MNSNKIYFVNPQQWQQFQEFQHDQMTQQQRASDANQHQTLGTAGSMVPSGGYLQQRPPFSSSGKGMRVNGTVRLRSTVQGIISSNQPTWSTSSSLGQGIVDGGASGHIATKSLAQRLEAEQLIELNLVENVHTNVMWGDGKTAKVIGSGKSKGLISSMLVVDDDAMPNVSILISEPTLSQQQNIIFVKGGNVLVGLQQGVMVIYAELSSDESDALIMPY